MVDRLTSFDTFQRLKKEREAAQRSRDDAKRDEAARLCLTDIVRIVDDTERLVRRLERGLKRDVARHAARSEHASAERLGALARRYERLSWQLHGQLRGMVDRARRDA